MSLTRFARKVLLNGDSPACLWRHPLRSAELLRYAGENALLPLRSSASRRDHRECSVCGWRGPLLKHFLSADEILRDCICPCCGSFARHRALALYSRETPDAPPRGSNFTTVTISGSPPLHTIVERDFGGHIIASDFDDTESNGGFGLRADLRQLPLADACADLVICLHVLEHIAELEACLTQIERILKPAGVAWLQVPFEPGQAESVRLESSPLRSHGHAWRFGMDVKTRLDRPSWEVSEYLVSERWSSREVEQYALDPPERFWVAHKRGASTSAPNSTESTRER